MLTKLNFHRDYFEAGKALSKRDRMLLWDALLFYAFEGVEPDLKSSVKAVFIALKARVDGSIRGAENARKSRGNIASTPEGPSKGPRQATGQTSVPNPSQAPSKSPGQGPPKGPSQGASCKTHPTHSEGPRDSTRVLEYKSTRVYEDIDDGVIGLASFSPPTPEEVASYFATTFLRGDPEAFFDYYAGQGWQKSNGMAIDDWRAVARSWSRRQGAIDAERSARGEPTAEEAVFRPVKTDEERMAELEAEAARNGWSG